MVGFLDWFPLHMGYISVAELAGRQDGWRLELLYRICQLDLLAEVYWGLY